jgi:hypothetical protein
MNKIFGEIIITNPDKFTPLPICQPYHIDENHRYLFCRDIDRFQCIFDGAAFGQYIGGIDPRNSNNTNTIGFINETCVVKSS